MAGCRCPPCRAEDLGLSQPAFSGHTDQASRPAGNTGFFPDTVPIATVPQHSEQARDREPLSQPPPSPGPGITPGAAAKPRSSLGCQDVLPVIRFV